MSDAPTKPRRKRAKQASGQAAPGSLELGTDKLYFKIGEVAEIVEVAAHVLRYWEGEFSLIKPQKSRSQQRVYRRKDVENLLRIKHLLYERKFTIAGARQELRGGTSKVARAPVGGLYLARRSLAGVREQFDQLAAVVRADPEPADLAADPAQFVRDRAGRGTGVATDEGAPLDQQLISRPSRE
jgi:DNA-binding transcriptional MerR regulator